MKAFALLTAAALSLLNVEASAQTYGVARARPRPARSIRLVRLKL